MTTTLTYRGSSSSVQAAATYAKNAPLTKAEIDSNFKSINEEKLEVCELTEVFDDILMWVKGFYPVMVDDEEIVLADLGSEYKVYARD